jgi:excisionase family DNA binding protein
MSRRYTVADTERVLLKPDEVAAMLGYSRAKIFDLISRGVIPSVRLGERGLRVRRSALEKLLDEQAVVAR